MTVATAPTRSVSEQVRDLLARMTLEEKVGQLLMLDARAMEWNDVRIGRNGSCSVCSHRPVASTREAGGAGG